MNQETKREIANREIKSHVLWAMGAGLVPIPLLDIAAVTAIQIDLISKLCRIYNVPYSESIGKTLLAALGGSTLARIGSSLVKGIPGIGTILGGISMPILSGASTYAVGQVFTSHFEANGTLDDMNAEAWKRAYEEQVELGKEFANRYQQEAKQAPPSGPASAPNNMDDVISKIEKLNQLREKGIISDEEFQNKKQQLLQKF